MKGEFNGGMPEKFANHRQAQPHYISFRHQKGAPNGAILVKRGNLEKWQRKYDFRDDSTI